MSESRYDSSPMEALMREVQEEQRERREGESRMQQQEARRDKLLEMMPRVIEMLIDPERQARVAELPFLLLPPRGQA